MYRNDQSYSVSLIPAQTFAQYCTISGDGAIKAGVRACLTLSLDFSYTLALTLRHIHTRTQESASLGIYTTCKNQGKTWSLLGSRDAGLQLDKVTLA